MTDMSKLFANASSFNQNLSCWNISNIDNMIEVFFDVQFGGKLWFLYYRIQARIMKTDLYWWRHTKVELHYAKKAGRL
jgi:hypothetical protein